MRKQPKIAPEQCDNYSQNNKDTLPEPSIPFDYETIYDDLDGPEPTLSLDNQEAVMKFFKQLTAFILKPTNNRKKSQRIISLRYLAAVYLLLRKEYGIPSAAAFIRTCAIEHTDASDLRKVSYRLKQYFDTLNN